MTKADPIHNWADPCNVDTSPYLATCVNLIGVCHVSNAFHEVLLTEQAEKCNRVLDVMRRAGNAGCPRWRIVQRCDLDGRIVDDVLGLLLAKGDMARMSSEGGKSIVFVATK